MLEWLAQIEPLSHKCWIALGWLGFVGLLALLTHYATPRGSEFVRKVVHIGTGHIILLAWWMQIPAWVGIGASIFFSLVSILSYWLPLLPSINNIGRRSWGTCFYAMSIGILVAWFWPLGLPQYAAIGILVMTWGDGLAGLLGRQYGRRIYYLWGSKKSWEGSVVMAVVSTIVTLAILLPTAGNHWQSWLSAVVIGLCAATLESFSKLGLDNLTVPVGSAAIAYGLMQVLA
ncbi:phosphatidate cytidylyltransferase [filamentous cyanobacterium LEGE 11480]|uniref:Phosphatidate cytidylyltransferase n=1 Tax=Romeriopsis navalis LEGE 11480 TaxID=2777977 RepID=A0A928VQA1_9CYAN|nr:diacylglycerol/polyprenol kinase family protein [Romeriopsis navalis]MBE9030562.1 phosphatidate cytidylyltransferase [Romeriopsis navalis LEGE 11480]